MTTSSDAQEVIDYFGFNLDTFEETTPKSEPFTLDTSFPTSVTLVFDEDAALALLAFAESHYRSYRTMPPVALLLEFWPTSEKFLDSQEFIKQLMLRGLPWDEVLTPDGFPVHFINAANLLLDHVDRRSKAAKLKSLGISSRQWNMWMKLPTCRQYFEREVDEVFKVITPIDSKQSLSRAVEAGDLNAIKYFNEFNGTYRPGQESLLNLAAILAKVMEILVKYVDPQVLPQVATELDHVIEAESRELTSGN